MPQSVLNREDALRHLYAQGAHLFGFAVYRDPDNLDQKSYHFPEEWQKVRDPLDRVLAAKHVGLKPGSLGVIVPDVDVKGMPASARESACAVRVGLVQDWAGRTPLVVRTPGGGAHLFYREDVARPKRNVAGVLDDAKLEVFGHTGFVELYDPVGLAGILDDLPVFEGDMDERPGFSVSGAKAGAGVLNGRGRAEGDRANGAFARARCAAERDASVSQIASAVTRAVKDAVAAGHSVEEALAQATRGLVYGASDRPESAPPPPDLPAVPVGGPETAPCAEEGAGDGPPPVPAGETAQEPSVGVAAGSAEEMEAWLAESRPADMPLPEIPSAPPGEPMHRSREPSDPFALAHAWASSTEGTWRCALSAAGRPSWHCYTGERGWQRVPLPYTWNRLRSYAREHYHRVTKEGKEHDPVAGTVNQVVKQAEEAARAFEGVVIDLGAMDADPFVTGLPEGVVDARKRSVEPIGPTYLVTRSARAMPGKWDRSRWLETLRYHVPDGQEQAWLGCYLGRAFVGGRDRVGLFAPGAKYCGKTTVAEAVRHAFGDYGVAASPEILMATGRGGDFTVQSGRAKLRGSRLVTMGEVQGGAVLDAAAIKCLISDDQVTGRLQGQDTVSFAPTWSIFFHMNDFPHLDYRDDAAWSRVVVLPFGVERPVESRDEAYTRILQQPEEAAAIVGWLLYHAWLWAEHGMPPQSVAMREAKQACRDASTPALSRFIAEHGRVVPDAKTWFADFRRAYVGWCRDQGEPMSESTQSLTKHLASLDGVQIADTAGRRRAIYGLTLVDQ